MNRMGKAILVTTVVLGAAGAGSQVFAHDRWGGGHDGGMRHEHRLRGDFWLTGLKAQLNITADQESAWRDFTQAMRDSQPRGVERARGGRSASATLKPAPEVLKERAGWMERRAKGAEERAAAMGKLYAVLTPVQRAIIDTHLADSRHHFHRR